jgi:acyl-coenzyme A synthetase/AMP-(fatty) acid ligase
MPTETLRPINASGVSSSMNLPKTISGKIQRVDLRDRENACEPDALTQEYRDR